MHWSASHAYPCYEIERGCYRVKTCNYSIGNTIMNYCSKPGLTGLCSKKRILIFRTQFVQFQNLVFRGEGLFECIADARSQSPNTLHFWPRWARYYITIFCHVPYYILLSTTDSKQSHRWLCSPTLRWIHLKITSFLLTYYHWLQIISIEECIIFKSNLEHYGWVMLILFK